MKQDSDEMTEEAPPPENLRSIEEKILAGQRWVKQGHYTKKDARWEQWKKNQKYLRCIWDDDWAKNQFTTFNVNSIYSNFHTKKPTLYFKNPRINVVPTKPEFTRDLQGNPVLDENGNPVLVDNYNAAKLLAVKINYELKEIGFKEVLKSLIGDNLCPFGVGWIKWGFQTLTASGHSNQRDRKLSYWCQRVDPRNIVYDWMATSMDDCKWIAERLYLTRKQCEDLGFKIPEGYVCSLPEFMKDRHDSAANGTKGEASDLVVIWEYHDLMAGTIGWYLIADKTGGITSELKPPQESGYPFDGASYEPLVIDKDSDDIIGLSDVEPIEDQALAINRMRSMEVKHIDNFGTTVVVEEGYLTENEEERWKKTPFGGFIKVKEGGIGKVQISTPPTLGNDHYRMSEVHKDDIRTTLGITEFQQGSSGSANTKATIGNIVQNSSNIRIEEQRDVIYDFVINCVRKLAAMIQEFSKENEYLNLKDEVLEEDYVGVLKKDYGFNPKIPFLKMSKKDIQGEFNFEFNIEDMIVRPKEVQLQQLTNLLGVIGSNPLMMQAVGEEDISMGKVVKKLFELASVDIEEFKKGGPAMLSPQQENQMFLNGMEVPEPHRKDHDDEHILAHMPVLQQIEGKLQEGTGHVQALQQQIQQLTQAAQPQADPSGMMAPQTPDPRIQQMIQQLTQQVQQLTMALQPLEQKAKKLRLHLQAHDQNQSKKQGSPSGGVGGITGAGQPQGQPSASMQTQMQAQIGA